MNEQHEIGDRYDGLVVGDAPDAVVAAIGAAFRLRHGAPTWGDAARSVVDRVRAAVSFDDWASGPTLALRGSTGPADGSRHLVYAVDRASGDQTIEIAISLYPASDSAVSLVGQVLDAGAASVDGHEATYLVEAMRGDHVVAGTVTSASGEFELDLPHDWSELVVVGPAGDVSIPAAPNDHTPA